MLGSRELTACLIQSVRICMHERCALYGISAWQAIRDALPSGVLQMMQMYGYHCLESATNLCSSLQCAPWLTMRCMMLTWLCSATFLFAHGRCSSRSP